MRRRRLGLSDRFAALDRVLELAPGRLDEELVERADAARRKADERLARGDGLVVAALVGGTGSGKSSLCNAVVGADVAPVGVRRPTTEAPRAVVGGDPAAADRLLDWLQVQHRHEGDGVADGLVLLDVPDHDSVALHHRAIVDRLVERVDVLVWVVDPLKYAMRVLHDGYLRRLAAHAEVVIVVLNRIDELDDADRRACAADLRRILEEEGLGRARVLETSARTGAGVTGLREALTREAAEHTAAVRRLIGDLRALARALAPQVGTSPAGPLDDAGVVEALAGAAGVGSVARTAAEESRAEGLAGTRPILSRGGAAIVRHGPRLLRHATGLVPGRAALPPGTPRAEAHTAPIGVRHAVVEVIDRVSGPLPARWRSRLHEVADVESGALARAVAAAVDRVPLRSPARWWWRLLAWVLSLCELAVLAGAVWLAVLAILAYLQLPVPEPPRAIGRLPWPTALLGGGLVLRLLGGVVRRRLVARSAAAYRRQVALELMDAVAEVAESRVVRPLRAELEAREELRELLADLQT